jgi:hypothetical protein
MFVKNTIISRIIIGLFLIMLTCWLPASGADNVSVIPVTTPFITIDPIGNHTVGDVFFINGTTNLPVSENISMHIQSTIIRKGRFLGDPSEIVAYISPISIHSDKSGINRWSVNATKFIEKLRNDEYDIVVEKNSCKETNCKIFATKIFFLQGNVDNSPTITPITHNTSTIPTVNTERSMTQFSGISSSSQLFVIMVIICIISIAKRRRR